MKKTRLLLSTIAVLLGGSVLAQDIDINVVAQLGGVNNGVWPMGATDGTILVTVCNNSPTAGTNLEQYRIRPSFSVPSSLQINSTQTGLPAGWTILSNDGTDIFLSNGTDEIPDGECREFSISVLTVSQSPGSTAQTIPATLFFADGVAPGNTPGAQTPDNDPGNDNSSTSVLVDEPRPVTLIDFTGKMLPNRVAQLDWNVASEINFAQYEVQRSYDGRNFVAIGSVPAKGSRHYSYNDRTIDAKATGIYYRLKMIDEDGSFKMSNVVLLSSTPGKQVVSLFPNPANDRVEISGLSGKATIMICNISGAQVAQYEATSDDSSIDITALAAGMYTVKIRDASGMTVSKLVKQ